MDIAVAESQMMIWAEDWRRLRDVLVAGEGGEIVEVQSEVAVLTASSGRYGGGRRSLARRHGGAVRRRG